MSGHSLQRVTVSILLATLVAMLGPACVGSADRTPAAEAEEAATEGDEIPMPELALRTLEGKPASLAEHSGKVLLVNFWTTWCPPCRVEIPDLNEIHNALGKDGLVILGVSPEDPPVVRRFLEQQKVVYPLLRLTEDPPHPVSEVYGSFPATFIIDREGMIAHVLVGHHPKQKVMGLIRPLL